MKTFLFSYLISLIFMISLWFPAVAERSFQLVPRLAFYMAFPLAIAVGLTLVCLGYVIRSASFELNDVLKRYQPVYRHHPSLCRT